MEINNPEKNITEIILKYEDGTEKVITKGIVIQEPNINEETGEHDITLNCAHISGNDFYNILYAMVNLAAEFKMFENIKECDEI